MPGDDATRLEIRRVFQAPRERVFAVFTTPEYIRQWMGGPSVDSPSAEVDLREGGRYRIALNPPRSEPFVIVGVFQEVRVPERLVYTWTHEGAHSSVQDSLVTVDFVADGAQTAVILRHERFANAAIRDEHHGGWIACFDAIAPLVQMAH
jgi:uncharacterized protein YndB with AHSA1/START domain